MKKKTIRILLSLLHVCIFCIGILIIFQTWKTRYSSVTHSSDMTVRIADEEPETVIEVYALAESEPEESLTEESNTEAFPTEESSIEEPFIEESFVEESFIEESFVEESFIEESPDEEPLLSYTFQYVRGRRNLNIRNGPSMQAKIIGKIPPGQGGRVLEFANDDWALIEYRGKTGYSSRHWMALTPVETD